MEWTPRYDCPNSLYHGHWEIKEYLSIPHYRLERYGGYIGAFRELCSAKQVAELIERG
jgi:hypothetical protein